MQKIIDYMTIVDSDRDELDRAVRGCIERGWQPFGGISIAYVGEDDRGYDAWAYALSMVKVKEDPLEIHVSGVQQEFLEISRDEVKVSKVQRGANRTSGKIV